MFSAAQLAAGAPPQVSLPQLPVANASVIAGSFGMYCDTRLPEPTTGRSLPSTADCISSVFQFMLMVTSLYGLKSRTLTEPAPPPPPPRPEPRVREPSDAHGCPEPLPPLLVAGSLP